MDKVRHSFAHSTRLNCKRAPGEAENAAQEENLLNINKWGNTGKEVTPVTIKKGTQFSTGKVAGGTGNQIYIPFDLQKAEENNIIRHYSKTEKLE